MHTNIGTNGTCWTLLWTDDLRNRKDTRKKSNEHLGENKKEKRGGYCMTKKQSFELENIERKRARRTALKMSKVINKTARAISRDTQFLYVDLLTEQDQVKRVSSLKKPVPQRELKVFRGTVVDLMETINETDDKTGIKRAKRVYNSIKKYPTREQAFEVISKLHLIKMTAENIDLIEKSAVKTFDNAYRTVIEKTAERVS